MKEMEIIIPAKNPIFIPTDNNVNNFFVFIVLMVSYEDDNSDSEFFERDECIELGSDFS